MKKLALLVFLVPGIAFAKTATSSLESKAIAAFSDIAKARTALDQGNDKTGDSWLTKAKALLTTLLQQNGTAQESPPEHGQQQGQQQTSPAEAPKEQQDQSALSRAENAAQKLEPSLAGKLGAPAQDQSQASSSSGALGAVSDLKSVYDKVSLAQSLLHKGNSPQAKSILDEIPTSPADALKLLHH